MFMDHYRPPKHSLLSLPRHSEGHHMLHPHIRHRARLALEARLAREVGAEQQQCHRACAARRREERVRRP